MNNILFSTGRDNWETPTYFFKKLDSEFHFTLDACATPENTKCEKFYTPEQNGLLQDWTGETVFCNPPYSVRGGGQDNWIKKCYEESLKENTTVVLLIPARTDTARFHDYIFGKASEIRWIRGRINFELNGEPLKDKKGNPMPAPFPSVIVVYR